MTLATLSILSCLLYVGSSSFQSNHARADVLRDENRVKTGNRIIDEWGSNTMVNGWGEPVDPLTVCDGEPCPPLFKLGSRMTGEQLEESKNCFFLDENTEFCGYVPEGYKVVTREQYLAEEGEDFFADLEEDRVKKDQQGEHNPSWPCIPD
ncbi:hypothetical protein DFJ73DRAFT_843946, partial [Zopfochytrium polystomum]